MATLNFFGNGNNNNNDTGGGGVQDLQLDIVGFLAILGEASVLANAQVTSLSNFSFLPRLLPAPQALIRYSRPERLRPLTSGRVVSSKSGNQRLELNHIASILHHNGNQLPDYSVRVIELEEQGAGLVKASSSGPLTWLAILGTAMSIGLTAFSVVEGDAASLAATLCLSVLSTIIGIGSKWKLTLPERKENRQVPPSDVIIKYPHGAFMIVKCRESTQRQLYWHPEKCEYIVGVRTYRFLSLAGTMLLMAGVICLANATINLQLAWAAAYVILNAAYWIVAALPQRLHWDLSAFKASTIEYVGGGPEQPHPSFTQALWFAIAITGESKWAQDFDIAPKSSAWNDWLAEARRMAKTSMGKRDKCGRLELPDWNAPQRLSEIFQRNSENEDAEDKA